jgi:hypothetical protein
MGFDYVPGDMLAALTAEGMEELDEISLHYCWEGFTPSQGTARTTLEIISGRDIEWTNMEWVTAGGGAARGSYEFPSPIGRRTMIRYPSGEQVTVPRHIPARNVRTTINAGAFSSERIAPVFAHTMRAAGLVMKTPVKRLARAAISRLPEGPTPEQREAMRWTIVCEAIRGEQERQGVISGKDVYGLTAAAIVEGAMRAASKGFDGSGALAPSQAFDPKDFLAELERFDVSWQVYVSQPPVTVEA